MPSAVEQPPRAGEVATARAGGQIEWYESRSAQAQRTYQRLKFAQISVGAVIPFLAGFQEQLEAALADELDLLPALLIVAIGVIVVAPPQSIPEDLAGLPLDRRDAQAR